MLYLWYYKDRYIILLKWQYVKDVVFQNEEIY